MSEDKDATFGEILRRGAREAAAHAAGNGQLSTGARVTRRTLRARQIRLRPPTRPSPQRIQEVRQGLDLSQAVFAALLNVSPATVRAWEQGQRKPKGPTLRLLEIAEHHPTALLIMADRSAVREGKHRDGEGEGNGDGENAPNPESNQTDEPVALGD